MSFESDVAEFEQLDLAVVDDLIRWLYRILKKAIEHNVDELDYRHYFTDRICKTHSIPPAIDPPLIPPNTTKGDPRYARWILETAVHTLYISPGRPAPLTKYYETVVINLEFYLGL